jgi:hypothetical protein
VSQLGLVSFLTKEPARVAAAVNKCWYFQQDHWTGQIIAGDGSTETYHFDGHYFFDKRWGGGGVQVENFTINHHTADPSTLPGFPASWKPYFGPGRGGVEFLGQVRADPNCQPGTGPGQSSHGSSGGAGESGGSSGKLFAPGCGLGGAAKHGLGKAHLGQTRAHVLRAVGTPARRSHGFLHFCDLAVHFGKGGKSDFIATVSRTFHSGRVRVGARLRAARTSLHGERVLAHRGSAYVLFVDHRGWRVLVGAEHGKVTFLAAVASHLTIRQLARLLVASGG